MKKRVVIAGLGDTGLLVALHLHPDFEVIGVSPKPCLVSGQELGTRLARPSAWRENYLLGFSRYRKLEGMRIEHARITRIAPERNEVFLVGLDGGERSLSYDALVIASGVTNGFWRTPELEDRAAVERRIDEPAVALAKARTIAVLGAGATGVSVASNLKEAHPDKEVHLFFGPDRVLPGYHPKVRGFLEKRLESQGVVLHPHHRATIPEGFRGEHITSEPVRFSTGQPPFRADAVVWAVGQQKPNTDFVPHAMLDAEGYVKADANLRVPGTENVFAVGDVAASDPNRSSARNSGFLTVAHNVRCLLEGKPHRMKTFRATPYRWGSILGVQNDGMRVFAPTGFGVLIGRWAVTNILYPWIVRRGIYKGIKDEESPREATS
ncbi:MAG: FAD-dependent oxidoreductase [Polyangiales bacterium]